MTTASPDLVVVMLASTVETILQKVFPKEFSVEDLLIEIDPEDIGVRFFTEEQLQEALDGLVVDGRAKAKHSNGAVRYSARQQMSNLCQIDDMVFKTMETMSTPLPGAMFRATNLQDMLIVDSRIKISTEAIQESLNRLTAGNMIQKHLRSCGDLYSLPLPAESSDTIIPAIASIWKRGQVLTAIEIIYAVGTQRNITITVDQIEKLAEDDFLIPSLNSVTNVVTYTRSPKLLAVRTGCST